MSHESRWAQLVWGPLSLSIASVALAVLSLLDSDRIPWGWVIAISSFIVVHSAHGYVLDQSLGHRFHRKSHDVHQHVLQLIRNLASLTGDRFDFWIVDIYLPRSGYGARRWLKVFPKKLVRELSISLGDVSNHPAVIDIEGPFRECINSSTPFVWFNPLSLGGTYELASQAENYWNRWHLSDTAKKVGLMVVWPIADQVHSSVRGVMIISVKPEKGNPLLAKGSLLSLQSGLHIRDACRELHKAVE